MPTQEEITNTIELLEQRISEPLMKLEKNFAVREGYKFVISLLQGEKEMIEVEELKTIQGRAIALLGLDYIEGECTQEILVNVPLKQGIKMSM